MAEKRTPTKKSPEKAARKSPEKAARKSPEKSAAAAPAKKRAPRAEASRKPGAVRVAALAAQQLLELTGKESEGVTGLERDEDGWRVQVEVLEVRRIPTTTDVLALYEVATDDQGELQSYRRLRRYTRGTPGDE